VCCVYMYDGGNVCVCVVLCVLMRGRCVCTRVGEMGVCCVCTYEGEMGVCCGCVHTC
jgi:hypothetical protein